MGVFDPWRAAYVSVAISATEGRFRRARATSRWPKRVPSGSARASCLPP